MLAFVHTPRWVLGLGLVALLCACGKCARPPSAAPRVPQATGPLAPTAAVGEPRSLGAPIVTAAQLDAAFAQAVSSTDGPYAVARAEILQHPDARTYLTQRRDGASAWPERLTAEIMLGWLEHKAQYDEAQKWVKDEDLRASRKITKREPASKLGAELAKLGPSVTPRVYEMWRKTHEFEDKYEENVLTSALEELRDPRMFEPMLALLDDRSEPEHSRHMAISVLKALGDARSVPRLRAVLLDAAESDRLRKAAAQALLVLARDDSRELFEGMLSDAANSDDLRQWMASMLFQLADPRSLPTLLAVLDTTKDDVLLGALCASIADVGDKSHVPALQRAHQRAGEDARQDCKLAIETLQRK
jgi:hypothetical protein